METMSKIAPTQKFLSHTRSMSTWKHRWAVLTKMSNLSNEEYVAKLDLYDNEAKWRGNSSDKATFVLENVTCIRPVKSKTHKYAFEVIEEHPVLVISGTTELDSYSWAVSLQQIFTPDKIEVKKDCYNVTVAENEDSRKWHLAGHHTLTVSEAGLSLENSEGTCVVSWALNSLVRFNVEPGTVSGHRSSLVIECGPKSPTGHSFFNLLSDQAEDILGAIRQSICLALTLKQNVRMSSSARHRSPSVTNSEKSFQRLYESQSVVHHNPQTTAQHNTRSAPQPIPMGRSDSGSSMCSFDSPGRYAHSPSSSLTTGHFSADFSSFLETEEEGEPHICHLDRDLASADATSCEKVTICGRRRSLSHPENQYMGNSDYSEIKDITDELKSVSRRNTISCEPADVDFDRLRSVSAVVALLKANNIKKSVGLPSPPNKGDDKSDFDSAFSSMALSEANEDLRREDEQPCSDIVCAVGQCSCVLARRRSSSTPDLQAYWKMNKFENVYEELSELGASVRRLNQKHEPETPPELPARPFLANSSPTTIINTKGATTKKKALLKMRGMRSFQEDNDTTDRLCVCDNVRTSRSPLSDGQCVACHCDETTDRCKTSLSEKSPKVKHTDSLFSAINDINSIILQVQTVKRRRSSDITPVAASFISSNSSDINYSSIASQQRQRDDLSGFSRWTSATPVNLIDLQNNRDDFQQQHPASAFLPNQAQNDILDSLTHFFLGDVTSVQHQW
ncbi:unnamed protein product [Candidula unifasciata]|uniref:PH domain-containing protein n=1 Tax=Candidula unifasciata TaxID=100452 RepID=A0A8S3ZNK6_9EUPU|nr:unnamed protein product [Candidula unifasciata]